jgi:hypothetical protein
MKSALSTPTGFANGANRMLRPRIVEALGDHGPLNAKQLARLVYGPRIAVRLAPRRTCTNSELVSTRRALRRLAAKGRIVAIGRYRRWKLYTLGNRTDCLASISLGRID